MFADKGKRPKLTDFTLQLGDEKKGGAKKTPKQMENMLKLFANTQKAILARKQGARSGKVSS